MKGFRNIAWLAVLLFAIPAQAQKFSTSLLYQVSVPTANTSDYIGKASIRGVTGSYRMYFSDYVSVGIAGGWHVFYEKMPPVSVTDGNLTLYGTQFRYINAFPIYLSPQVHLPGTNFVKPYVGLGIGTTYFMQNTQMGFYAFDVKQWLFGLYPEAGLMIPLTETLNLNVAGRYNHLFQSGDITSPQGYVGINVGITKMIER